MRLPALPILFLLLASSAGASAIQLSEENEDSNQTITSESQPAPAPSDTLAPLPERLTADEYRFAGGPRYTVTGDLPLRHSQIQPVALGLTTGALAALVTAIHIYQYKAWWENDGGTFHSQVEWDYAAQADKFGHAFAGYTTSYIAHEALVTSGVSHDAARWIAPLFGMAFTTYVEIEDGFAGGWGFDPTDEAANTLGAAFFAAQQYLPSLQNLAIKWSYWPTDPPTYGRPAHTTTVVDDYNSTVIWFSLKMANILPESAPWPRWLRLAIGYGTQGANRMNDRRELYPAERRIFIGLDYDLVELLPDLGSFGNWLVQTVDMFHLPAPALQIYPDTRFSLLFPITL